MDFGSYGAKAALAARKKVMKGPFESLNAQKLEKAKIYVLRRGIRGKPTDVQFNPSEYKLSRSLRTSKSRALGRDPDISKLQAVGGDFATLTLSLYFDSITELSPPGFLDHMKSGAKQFSSMRGAGGSVGSSLKGGAKSVVKGIFGKKTIVETGSEFSKLLKYNEHEHAPLRLRFVWGTLDFTGYLTSSSMSYTMFSPNGTPLQAKVDLTLQGEETTALQKRRSRTFCSPNRTKERVLTEGDQLWMMAEEEYDDPSQWKTIAKANGILNPRKLEKVTTLKVPSIK